MVAKHRTLEVPPDQVDAGVGYLRNRMLPEARQIEGFRGMIAMVDRERGKAVTVTLWDSDEALQASEAAGERVRSGGAPAGAERPTIERFEVVLTEIPNALSS
jgi:heme-degrading monooxygenase HmoA